jgi:hypothetical protein
MSAWNALVRRVGIESMTFVYAVSASHGKTPRNPVRVVLRQSGLAPEQ